MSIIYRPRLDHPHRDADSGELWFYLDQDSIPVAIIHRAYGAGFAGSHTAESPLTCLCVGSGLPPLPRTRDKGAIGPDGCLTRSVPFEPLTWEQVAAEIEAGLSERGLIVIDSAPRRITRA